MLFVSHAPRPQIFPSLMLAGIKGGTVSMCVFRMMRGETLVSAWAGLNKTFQRGLPLLPAWGPIYGIDDDFQLTCS